MDAVLIDGSGIAALGILWRMDPLLCKDLETNETVAVAS
jgi:hypothetical protein